MIEWINKREGTMKRRNLMLAATCALVMAACGGTSADTTTTADAAPPGTEAESTTTTAAAPESTTTTAGETTTTSSGGQASGDLAVIQQAMAKSAELIPSRTEGVIKMVGLASEEGPIEVEMPFAVATDPATGNTSMSMDFGAMAGAMGSEEIPPEMAALMGTMEIREVDNVTYMNFPFFTAFLGAETDWISMPAEEGTDLTEGFGSGNTPTDPASYLESLSDAGGSAEVVGPEEIRGIATTRYRVPIDDTWRDQLSAEELAKLEAQGPLPSESFPLDLWIDDDGLVHRMSIEVAGTEVEGGEDFESMTMTFDFFDFGQPVSIEAPPAEDVTPMDDLAGGFFGGSTP